MPEYLSPGVYIEEVPARIKAIEGVSTSTAGFVGESERGPVPGYDPFTLNIIAGQTFELPPDLSPPLVTSFAQYIRLFGRPTDDPVNFGYLGHSVRAFFDNGGKRAYIARVRRTGDTASSAPADTGVVFRLTRRARENDTVLFLNSVRGLAAAPVDIVALDGTTLAGNLAVNAVDTRAMSLDLGAALPAGSDFQPGDCFIRATGTTTSADDGPIFHARSPGLWGDSLGVTILCEDRAPVDITQAAAAGGDRLAVRSTSSFYLGALVEIDSDGTGATREQFVVEEIGPGATIRLDGALANATTTAGTVRTLEFQIVIDDAATGATESFGGLSWNSDPDPRIRRRHYATIINNRSRLVWVQPPWAAGGNDENPPDLSNQPMTENGARLALTGGGNGTPPGTADIEGVDGGPGNRTGIQALANVDDIRLIAAPGRTEDVVQNALIAQCERMRYRFAVLDAQRALDPTSVVNGVLAHRNLYDSSFAGYYFPWVEVKNNDAVVQLPPSGFVMGVCARVDNERGVHKAPANETVRIATGLAAYTTTGEQDILNPRGVNVIRRFEGRGIRIWGARTLSSDPDFKYVNVRRTMIFLSASIDRGTQWVVFEPNSPPTWSRVVDSISAFLTTQWRDGALFGRKPEDAFYVRCDESTMSEDDILNGRLICEIGVAIVRPAEFVIFRIEQLSGFATT